MNARVPPAAIGTLTGFDCWASAQTPLGPQDGTGFAGVPLRLPSRYCEIRLEVNTGALAASASAPKASTVCRRARPLDGLGTWTGLSFVSLTGGLAGTKLTGASAKKGVNTNSGCPATKFSVGTRISSKLSIDVHGDIVHTMRPIVASNRWSYHTAAIL